MLPRDPGGATPGLRAAALVGDLAGLGARLLGRGPLGVLWVMSTVGAVRALGGDRAASISRACPTPPDYEY